MLYSDDGYPLKLIPNQGKATTTTKKTPLVPQVIHELLETVIDCKPHMFSLTVFFLQLYPYLKKSIAETGNVPINRLLGLPSSTSKWKK